LEFYWATFISLDTKYQISTETGSAVLRMKRTDRQPTGYERFEVLAAVVMKRFLFWYITPCIPLKVIRRLKQVVAVSCLAYSSTLKMDVTFSSETSVDFQRTTLSYIPEN
jgi:hypothetical protein